MCDLNGLVKYLQHHLKQVGQGSESDEVTLTRAELGANLCSKGKDAVIQVVLSGQRQMMDFLSHQLIRIHCLCSAQDDILARIRTFLCRLRSWGHQLQQILPIFNKAIVNAKKYIATINAEC